MNIIEIMRLTDAVYECEDFKEIKDPMNPKRYVRFVCNNPHSKYQSALTNHLENIGDGDAVIKKRVVEKDGKYILSDRGFMSVTLVDMSKVTNYDEMSDIVQNEGDEPVQIDAYDFKKHCTKNAVKQNRSQTGRNKKHGNKIEIGYQENQ